MSNDYRTTLSVTDMLCELNLLYKIRLKDRTNYKAEPLQPGKIKRKEGPVANSQISYTYSLLSSSLKPSSVCNLEKWRTLENTLYFDSQFEKVTWRSWQFHSSGREGHSKNSPQITSLNYQPFSPQCTRRKSKLKIMMMRAKRNNNTHTVQAFFARLTSCLAETG